MGEAAGPGWVHTQQAGCQMESWPLPEWPLGGSLVTLWPDGWRCREAQ